MSRLYILGLIFMLASTSYGQVKIYSFPPGAYVRAVALAGQGSAQTGTTTATAALSLELAEGPWRLHFALDDHRPTFRDIDVLKSSFTVSEVLSRAKATLKISVTPFDASIWLDGRLVDPLDLPTLLLAPGRYRLRVTRPGFRDYLESFTLVDGMVRTLGVSLVKAPELPISFTERTRRLGFLKNRFEKRLAK